MALVRAKKNVYLGEHGHHEKGEEFEYNGPENPNLEPVEPAVKAKPEAEPDEEEVAREFRGKKK